MISPLFPLLILYLCSARTHAGSVPTLIRLANGQNEWNLPVSTPVGAKISQVIGKDDDPNTSMVYSIINDKEGQPEFFSIDPKSGIVRLKEPLDIKNFRHFTVSVSVNNGYMPARAQVPVHVLPDNTSDIRSTVDDMAFASQSGDLSPPRTVTRPRVTAPEVVAFTAGPEILVTDPPKHKPRTKGQPATTTSTDHEPTENTKIDAVGQSKGSEGTKEAGQDGLKKEQEPESMANKNNLNLLWLLLPGVVLFVAVAGFICYRMRRAPVKEKVLIAKSMSVETGQTFCKDDQLKAKEFGTIRKEPLQMVVSNNRYLYRKRSANLAAAPIQTSADGYLQPTATDEDWEFPREQIRIMERVGEGCFGQVFKAEAMEPSGHTTIVAVKTLKEHASDKERRDLLAELQVMKSLEPHANVVQLLGCCTDQDPIFVIMEFISLGKLQSFLRRSRNSHYYGNISVDGPNMTASKLTSFAFQVARGMEYLSTKGILHRDLAARNILITEDLVCKVSDFGLARDVIDCHIYERKSEGRLPIRWMAPESLFDNIFTTHSDVWSFGVLLWEIVTLGSTPYPGMSAGEVMRQIRDGYRMEKPVHCSRELYNLMFYCWEAAPVTRPSFEEIANSLGVMLAADEDYLDLNQIPQNSYYNTIITDISGEKV